MSTAYPLRFEVTGSVAGSPEAVFGHLDDPHRLSSHMEKPSMGMLGTGMSITTDARGGRAIGSIIRMEGRVFGIPLRLEESVTERDPPVRKAWETSGEPHLLVIGVYRMGFRVAPSEGAAMLTVFIEYALPTAGLTRLMGKLLGGVYARWCCRRMLDDAKAAFGSRPAPSVSQGQE